jgi:radical SAM superfamily enzyme YgiQ (UPF0313 family)
MPHLSLINKANDAQNLINKGKKKLKEKDRIVVEESYAILDKCRKRANKRSINKIALIQPRKGGRPSLGLLYIGAYLLDNFFEVKIFEFLDELYPPNIQYNKRTWKKLYKFDPDFIGFNVISSTFRIVQRMITEIREKMPGKIIICGGKHATSNPEDLLNIGADYCTIGEAEITIVELLDVLKMGRFTRPPRIPFYHLIIYFDLHLSLLIMKNILISVYRGSQVIF